MTIPEVQTPAPGPAQPRAVGAASIAVRQAGGISRLADLRQEGSLKLLLPRRSGAAVEAVLLNTAGGLTGGDAMEVAALAEAEAQLVLTTQAAERAYRARPGPPARVRAHSMAPAAVPHAPIWQRLKTTVPSRSLLMLWYTESLLNRGSLPVLNSALKVAPRSPLRRAKR